MVLLLVYAGVTIFSWIVLNRVDKKEAIAKKADEAIKID